MQASFDLPGGINNAQSSEPPEPPKAPSSPGGDADNPGADFGEPGRAGEVPGGTPGAGVSVVKLIAEIRAGIVNVGKISRGDRRACVEHLSAEGFSRAEIGKVLHLGDATVSRDRAAIRRMNALHADPRLAGEWAGELARLAESTIEQIRRAVRDPEVPVEVRIDALVRCFEITRDLVKTLQSLGYLPTAALQVNAQMTQRRSPQTTVAGMRAELERIRNIQLKVRPNDEQMHRDFASFERTILMLCEAEEQAAKDANNN